MKTTTLIRNIERDKWLEFRLKCMKEGISVNEGVKRLVYRAVANKEVEA